MKCDCENGEVLDERSSLRHFNGTGLWAGTARRFGRAYQAGTVRISARRAVLGPKARHETRRGTAREARRAVPARPPTGRAWPGPGPLANNSVWVQRRRLLAWRFGLWDSEMRRKVQ